MDIASEFEHHPGVLGCGESFYGDVDEWPAWRSFVRAVQFTLMLPIYLVVIGVLLPMVFLNAVYNFAALVCYTILIYGHHVERRHPELFQRVTSQLRVLLLGRPTSMDFLAGTVTRNYGS